MLTQYPLKKYQQHKRRAKKAQERKKLSFQAYLAVNGLQVQQTLLNGVQVYTIQQAA